MNKNNTNKTKEKGTQLIERENTNAEKQRMKENQLKGNRAWLNSQPIKAHGRYLTKGGFQDALRLRMGIPICGMAKTFGCGKQNDIIHAKNQKAAHM